MNRTLWGLLLVAGVLVAIPRAAAAQEVISRGAIVRVTAPSVGLVGHRGRLDDVTTDSIRVDALRIARVARSASKRTTLPGPAGVPFQSTSTTPCVSPIEAPW